MNTVNIYETSKMRVEIDNASVRKTFKPSPNQRRRFKNEKIALLRLKGS